MKAKPKIMLHMHQIRDFLDDRYSFYEKHFLGLDPKHYQYKGVKKAFQMGSALDYALKKYYMNNKNTENLLDSVEFKTLPTKTDQVIAMGLIDAYITKYGQHEHFHSFGTENFTIPFRYNKIKKRKLHNEYVIYISPDLTAKTFWENELVVLEIKSTANANTEKDYNAETLDFQTMTYCWGIYRHSFNMQIPRYVIKRTLFKPKLKIRKKETESEFQKRIVCDMVDSPDKYLKATVREIDVNMIIEYEKYLTEILCELDECLAKGSKYKFYKKSSDYWGT